MTDPDLLAVWRRSAGYTQDKLAAAMDVDRSTVHRWEKGRSRPRDWQIPRLAQLLGRRPGDIGALLWQQGPETTEQGSPPEVSEPSAGMPSWNQLDSAVTDWAALGPTGAEPAHTLWATEEDLALIGQMLAMFRQLDHTFGGRTHAQQVVDYLDREIGAVLHRPAASPDVAVRRAMLTAEFCELAGYQAVDNGQPARAQEYYQRALQLSSSVGDRAYSAYLTAVNLGHLALHCGRPELALQWASTARASSTGASPATRAAVAAVVARANARLGREAEATAMLIEAEHLLESVQGDDPLWIGYFTPAYLADEAAHCLHDLGRPPAARTQLVDALSGVGGDRVRRRALDAALLASTWVVSGDLDQAVAVGRQAVEYTARTGSGRCVERVATVLDALGPHLDYAPVQELHDFTRAVLPSTFPRPGTT
ncbi:helix-turn-helix transcriptional regulator [Kitasatospora sp. NA04385]|uniref:helix-turn-helix transcriptional regulator n=1 Tax=Kitasatospora sp. NA04385 TaxID=2742135 RepID=UPI00158FA610|nr:helix-turn-helix transcriptional regulator [Kitasatospora sp. NA04385]QKW20570.1 helix-turn-helix transcriptional regulator [Kitasatospora sp. NA04385]